MKSRPRLLRITTVPISLKLLLRGQLAFMKVHGFEVLAVSADGKERESILSEGIEHIVIPFTRKITPLRDLLCLAQLIILIRKTTPDIVHTHTPKAGLLGMVAAWICRVPVRMHTVAGLPLMEARGLKRKVLIITEKITYRCANAVYPNSQGLLNFIRNELSIVNCPLSIIGRGSSNGIDVSYFSRTTVLENEGAKIRVQYHIPKGAIVFCFVGRIVKDKGISELTAAFKRLSEQRQDIYLLLVGPLEQELDPLDSDDLAFLQQHPCVVFAGYQNDIRPWMIASDVFVFPSYREGFPNVVMQAACLEVSCVVSDINGCNELIMHESTGLIVPPKNSGALYDVMKRLGEDQELRAAFASKARGFVAGNFDQQYVWDELRKEYFKQLTNVGNKQSALGN